MRRCFSLLLAPASGSFVPPKPRKPRSIETSMSSENRSITLNTLGSDVPPLKIRCSPITGSWNNSFNVQQTQKSFSTICACMLRGVAVPSKKILRSSGFSFTKSSMLHDLVARRRMMSTTHAGA